MTTVRPNGSDSTITVDHIGDKVSLTILSVTQGSHTVNHTIVFDHPEFALSLAEGIREAATTAKIYEENNPN